MKNVNAAFFVYIFFFAISLFVCSTAFSQTSGNPSAQNDNITTLENQQVVIIVLNNDLGVGLNISFVATPTNGTAALNADNTVTYTPNTNFIGTDSFTYQVSDDVGATSEAIVTITVLDDVNNNVVTQANDDEYFSVINELVVADVLANDTGEGLFINDIPLEAANGLVGINSDNTLLYVPDVDFFGTDSFTYTIMDAAGTTSTATVTIYIADPSTNNAPNIESFTVCTQPITPTVICHSFSDPDGHSVSYDQEETHTTFNCSIVYLNDTCIRYTALPGFLGTDTIFAVICDDQIPPKCSTSKIVVHIGNVIHPDAADDTVVIGAETLTVNDNVVNDDDAHNGAFLTVLDNDYDACQSDLQVINIVDNPDNGTAVLQNGQLLYTPDAGFEGADMLEYVVCNDIPLCDTALVTILVEENNACNYDLNLCLPPFQAYEICPSFCNINADEISGINAETNLGIISQGSNAQCFYFVPPDDLTEAMGQTTFTACTAGGDCSQTVADIFISQNCGGNPPIAQDDLTLVQLGETVTVYVTENDIDIDGQGLTVTNIVELPNCGEATIVGGSNVTYIPTTFCADGDFFLYEVCDLSGLCDTATVFVNIQNNTDCDFQTEYCTQPVQPIELCVEFCSLIGSTTIIDAETTFNCSISLLGNNCIQYTALPGYAGTDVVTIIGENETGQTESVEVFVHVGCIEPTALSDAAIVENHEPTPIDVLANDVVLCDGILYPSLVESPSNGSVTINNNILVYTPDADFVGTDTFVYNSCNDCENLLTPGEPVCAPATVTVQVLADGTTTTPEPFDIEPDLVQTPFNTFIIIDVFANDSGENIFLNNVTSPVNGSVSIGLTNEITYTPNEGFVGYDYFFYQVCNDLSDCETTLVGVEVLPENNPNLPPNTNNDVLDIEMGEQSTIAVLANDSDPENEALTIGDIITSPFNGTASITADNEIIYTPNSDAQGQDSFVYEACDPQGECTQAIVVINIGVEPANNPPLAEDDEESLGENGQVQIYILANDSDEDQGQNISTTLLTTPIYGEIVENDDESVTYTLTTAGFEGFDYFHYIICDNGLPVLCDTAFVLIGVGQTNIPPNAVDDVVATTVNNYIDIDVLANDSDFDDGIENVTIQLVLGEEPVNGVMYLNGDNEFSYTPNENFIGTDTFMYEICDPLGACNQATVIIHITAEILAQPDIAFTLVNESVVVNVINNDIGENISLNMVLDLPDHGIIVNADPVLGTFEYQPNNAYVGADHFIYQICDEVGNCATTIVAINVLPAETENLAPTPNNDVATAAINETIVIFALSNDSDPNNDALEIDDITVLPQNGTADIDANGNISYVPSTDFEGCDTLTYLVCDTEPLCVEAQIVISVGNITECINNPPLAENDEAQVQEGTIAEIDVLANDIDTDGEIETVILGSSPTNGEASVFDNQIVYIPDNGYVGIDHFVYIVCDNGTPILCDTAIVTMTVLGQNIDAEPDLATTAIQTPVEIAVLSNDSGTDINVTAIISNPENGTVTINIANNVITYTPDTLFVGTDYFLYQICDDITEQCDTTIVSIQVLADAITNIQPNAVNDIDSTNINQAIDIDILANDNDPFGGTELTTEILISTINGTLTENTDGTFEYMPNGTFAGIDSFTYEICDNGTPILCDTAIVIIFVGGENVANIAPQTNDDIATTNLEVPVEIDVLANDTDEDNDNLTIVSISEPTHGQAEISDNIVVYTPDQNYLGTDYFTYIACDDGTPALCDTAYVTINVSQDTLKFFIEAEPNTSLQFCLNEYIEDETFVIDTVAVILSPEDGSLIVINGCITYIPTQSFQGEDSFILEVCNEADDCLLMTFCSTVGDVPQPPVAIDDNALTTINTFVEIEITDNDFDPDGDELISISIIIPSTVVGSTFSIDVNLLTITYTPANNFMGIDSLAYVITDATGLISDTAWVFITVDSLINVSVDTLEAFDDESTTLINTEVDIDILQNDILPEEIATENVTITLLEAPQNGTVAAAANQQVTYLPSLDFVGEDSFIYEICVINDDEQLCDTATVHILIENLSDCQEEPIFASGFSPNDDGINDVFLVENIDCYAEFQPTFTIFNRWGDVVYNAVGFTNQQAWNGRWQNINEGVTEGTYFYMLDLNNNKENSRKTGFVEVRR